MRYEENNNPIVARWAFPDKGRSVRRERYREGETGFETA
jgi:hypothetical protein